MSCRIPIAAAVLALASVGCAPTLPDLRVEEQWREALERQSLYAIFPITEDLMVGDVLLDSRDVPGARNDNFRVVRIARSEPSAVLDVLCQDRERRLRIGPMPEPKVEIGPQEQQEQSEVRRQDLAPAAYFKCPQRPKTGDRLLRAGFPAHDANVVSIGSAAAGDADLRLMRSDIPETTVARVTTAALQGGGVLGNIGIALGLSSAGRVALTIKLRDLQHLQIEPTVAQRLLDELITDGSAANPDAVLGMVAQVDPSIAGAVCRGDFRRARAMKVAIVTRVEYAGGVSFEFSEGQLTGLKTVADLSALLRDQPQPTSAPSLGSAPSTPTPPADDKKAAQDRAAALTAELQALLSGITGDQSSALGGRATIGIGSSGRVALISTYKQPMAVGAGSTLIFPVEDALLAAGFTAGEIDDDVRRTLAFCRNLGSSRADWVAYDRSLDVSGVCRNPDGQGELARITRHLCASRGWSLARPRAQMSPVP